MLFIMAMWGMMVIGMIIKDNEHFAAEEQVRRYPHCGMLIAIQAAEVDR